MGVVLAASKRTLPKASARPAAVAAMDKRRFCGEYMTPPLLDRDKPASESSIPALLMACLHRTAATLKSPERSLTID